MSEPREEHEEHLPKAYDRLLERAVDGLKTIGEKAAPPIHGLLEQAREKAVELGELTAEESERIRSFVSRDLHDAARHLVEEERDMADWLRLDLLLIERRLLHRFSTLTELTRLEFEHIKKAPRRPLEWHTGEITGIGTLECDSCGKRIHFYKAGHIPPCPVCRSSRFHRAMGK